MLHPRHPLLIALLIVAIGAAMVSLMWGFSHVTLLIYTSTPAIPSPVVLSPVPSIVPLPTSAIQPPSQSHREEIVWGNRKRKQVIFTFDGGSGTQSAQAILNTLARHQLQSTFFLTGQWASKNKELVAQIASLGHEIFNHTYTHPHLTELYDEEIIKELQTTEDVIIGITGITTRPFFRAPYGDRNAHVREVAAEQGYQSVFWTVDALDWKESEGMSAQEVKERILSRLAPGNIYLMHIGDTITGDILEEVINEISAQGYGIVPLSQGIQ